MYVSRATFMELQFWRYMVFDSTTPIALCDDAATYTAGSATNTQTIQARRHRRISPTKMPSAYSSVTMTTEIVTKASNGIFLFF